MTPEKRERREAYEGFCASTYVPIYSQPWWMDAVCGPASWDVWLHGSGGSMDAAMPYYLEGREHGLYITKAPLTQNNGIVFRHPEGAGPIARAKFEERVIRDAMAFVDALGLAVYEQQFQTSFTNWLPFSWLGCEALTRYTYVIRDTSDLDAVWTGVSSKQRAVVRKGARSVTSIEEVGEDEFYDLHEGVFTRQGLRCPFSRELWSRLYGAVSSRGAGKALCALGPEGEPASVVFVVWDGRRAYHLLGGGLPGSRSRDTYAALIWHAIGLAHERGVAYDFEGSMIERISRSFREFGGVPEPYFRIRKVYSADVVRMEAEARIEGMALQHGVQGPGRAVPRP